ncbi:MULTISPECIES: amidohydrolase family protein [unclassified Paenibacillus]|uniref:amidohydrolase family protein n=1 Tax=unclassified Paenibacillus TaxID=185978 RepID=UPI002406D09F|nr:MULTISPECIES: amidohydrolase family protein [unclassified Paenibacillus]MDF9844747.1 imidazolonepropionase-like amidohydrolase [Paenibacillus sp. PastF-2]MDF9851349.1 imidazolonepropionase-like amidohydrolase [Paenibacillus sp. PastM-2]MDF9857931.1 imidazolonepropionase-like amidohydrolase [Paenibacillus sp. PastF-1]MDH6483198.1 imidazolonepropionase-like amidohydrolase [Paenibacillus sp. PastH-2]MDH6510609.1 imidazolonepropionase-like amidohydrolase [Paenibacillus sp. PastM-3]
MITAITNAKIFDGEKLIEATTVLIEGEKIISVGGVVPVHAVTIDAKGKTLLPGLIDAHVHTSEEGLRDALNFGVTTELEMMGGFTRSGREEQLKGIDDIADVRSAGMGVTPPGGHPDELMPGDGEIPDFVLKELEKLSEEERNARLVAHAHDHEHAAAELASPDEAVAFVQEQVRQGADYIKIMIEEGSVLAAPGLPVLSQEIMRAAVEEAHRQNKITLAHVLTVESAKKAIDIGIDGLAHIFIDRPDTTADLVKRIADADVFVTPCLVLNSSIIGNSASELASDTRVNSKLSEEWVETLNSSFNTYPQGSMEDNYRNVMDLHRAGVDILVGTDVSVPVPSLGGLAHGASVHHEMQLLVKAGFTPVEALQSATSKTARRFSLNDRGRIVEGARADLLLVEGDPTTHISDTLSISEVWLRGDRKINKNY